MNSNKKSKHKRGNKVPDPPQVDEKTDNVDEKVVVESVTEVVSEIVTPLDTNPDETKCDAPKKPKRSRGKKKKQDDENTSENKEENIAADVVKREEPADKELLDTPVVVPSTRKKKNKKKAHGSREDLKLEDQAMETVEEVKVETKTVETKDDTSVVTVTDTKTEAKPPKKKNKKKKRNDSERSDKSEDIACTAAFQSLLETKNEESIIKDDKAEELFEEILKEVESVENKDIKVDSQENIEVIKDKDANVTAKEDLQQQKEQIPIETVEQMPKSEGKGKKKHKKDKKHPPKEEHIFDALIETKTEQPEQMTPKTIEPELPTEGLPPVEDSNSPKPDTELELAFVEEKASPKPKAKIAKPVEKKRKGKQDAKSTENLIETCKIEEFALTEPQSKQETKVQVLSTDEVIPEDTIVKEKIESTTQAVPVTVDLVAEPVVEPPTFAELISIPDTKMGKKGKKSPKPPKQIEEPSKFQYIDDTKPEVIKPEKMEETVCAQTVIQETEPLKDIPPLLEEQSSSTVPIMPEIIGTIVQIEEFEIKQQAEDNTTKNVPESKPSKKKKKGPKTPMPIEPQPVLTAPTEVVTEDLHKNKEPSETVKEATETPINISEETKVDTENIPDTAPVEIEVSYVKAEEFEDISNDPVPDIHYPRSASQQLLDDNNNMVIQEILTDDIKHELLIPTVPIIEGSGETPIATPELISSGITMTDIKFTEIDKAEKTDLKSKVLEVNQEMEELRLSIERSLAEFTALEKKEKEAEETFEKADIAGNVEIKNEPANIETKTEIETEVITNQPIDPEIKTEKIDIEVKEEEATPIAPTPPVCPARKDNKGRSKSKKKGKQDTTQVPQSTAAEIKDTTKDKKEEKPEQKTDNTQEKGKQQSNKTHDSEPNKSTEQDYDPIEKFEDALTSSVDDVNKTFELIANEVNETAQQNLAATKPDISITSPEDTEKERDENNKHVTPPKNLLGHPDIPVQSNRNDYKKEKDKIPNNQQAKVKIKDAVDVEKKKQSKECQTEGKIRNIIDKSTTESFSRITNGNDEYVYKYSFRKVFLQSACHVCKKELTQSRVPCNYCNLVFYCNSKHKDEDWAQHQALCFAVSTITHLKDQKHIYAGSQNVTGHSYRLLRMQMIVSCEKVLKRRLAPWEQEAMLYPRMCADVSCREWRQAALVDCEGCGQISYCKTQPDHLPKSHQRWCKSYALYQKLVCYQQTKGRLEPKLPSKVMVELKDIPEKINEVLASMYEEKIDMNDIKYAALTQLATAPLTAVYCDQLCRNKDFRANGITKKSSFTIHVVGAELQFEADVLNKWEVFFLHVRPDVQELRVVLLSPVLNPSNLPLDLLSKIKLCENCCEKRRKVVFYFQDKMNYEEYRNSSEFVYPDIVCAFNVSIERSSVYNGKDPWPATLNAVLKLRQPFVVTSHTLAELRRDVARIKECTNYGLKTISDPKHNAFASVRPDRNFISDDEMPLLFKNFCYTVICGDF